MEDNILISTKKIIGLSENYDAFDLDVLTHINAAMSEVNQLGVGPSEQTMVDIDDNWSSLGIPTHQLAMVKTFIFLTVRLLFDPPATSFHINAAEEQIKKLAWRLNVSREETDYVEPSR